MPQRPPFSLSLYVKSIVTLYRVKNRFIALSAGINLGRPINSDLSHLMTPDLDV